MNYWDRIGEKAVPKGQYRSRGIGYEGRTAWAAAGFYNDHTRASKWQLNGRRSDEPRTCIASTEVYKGPLTFNVCSATAGEPNWDGLHFQIICSKDGSDGQPRKYTINYCRIPGIDDDAEALERAKTILRNLGLLDE